MCCYAVEILIQTTQMIRVIININHCIGVSLCEFVCVRVCKRARAHAHVRGVSVRGGRGRGLDVF